MAVVDIESLLAFLIPRVDLRSALASPPPANASPPPPPPPASSYPLSHPPPPPGIVRIRMFYQRLVDCPRRTPQAPGPGSWARYRGFDSRSRFPTANAHGPANSNASRRRPITGRWIIERRYIRPNAIDARSRHRPMPFHAHHAALPALISGEELLALLAEEASNALALSPLAEESSLALAAEPSPAIALSPPLAVEETPSAFAHPPLLSEEAPSALALPLADEEAPLALAAEKARPALLHLLSEEVPPVLAARAPPLLPSLLS